MAEPADALAAFDVADPAFLADPYPALGALREAGPIHRDPRGERWLVTRFDDVARALRDRRLGRAFDHRYTHDELGVPEPDPRWRSFHEHERWSLLALEPPDHTRLRRLVSKVFTPSAVAARDAEVAGLSARLLDRCLELGEFDLLADYARPFSVGVICAVLGWPVDDAERLLEWSHAIVKMYELDADDATKQRAERAAAEYIERTRELIAEKRAAPDGLLLSELVAVEDGGETLSEAEITSTAMVLVEAGHEATVNTLGNGFRALTAHPDQWRRVTSGDVDPADAVEELIRFDAPLQLFERWVLDEGVSIGGRDLAVGERIAMLFGSAQRDPRRFDHPDRFDVGRADPGHIGFGGGLHFCVGAPLARAELAVSVAHLAERAPDLELVEQPVRHPTFVIRGLEALRLRA